MYLITINILWHDYKVYGLTQEEWKKNKKLSNDSNGHTNILDKKIYIQEHLLFFDNGKVIMNWDEIEYVLSHEIGHILEDKTINWYSFRKSEIQAEFSSISYQVNKKNIPLVIKAWKDKLKEK